MRDAPQIAAKFKAAVDDLPQPNTASIRKLRGELSKRLSQEDPDCVIRVARQLIAKLNRRWVAYELIANHKETYLRLDDELIEKLGHGIDSWHTVDAFARILAGPAWRDGLIHDETVYAWAESGDRWWRRSALVSTVALNVRTYGGTGDTQRTLTVCRKLVTDHDDMVVKALSWALRELVVHDAEAVAKFLHEQEHVLAARVKREVRNKLETGLKSGTSLTRYQLSRNT